MPRLPGRAPTGYQPINGEPRTIRYRLYSQNIDVASNAGFGVVAGRDIERAATDVMSIKEGDFEYVARIALSDEPVKNTMDHMRDLRDPAIWELASGRFDADSSREVLRRIAAGDSEFADTADSALGVLGWLEIEKSKAR